MSQEKLVFAISALSAALADAGLTGVTITVGAPVANTVVNNVVVEEQKEAEKPTGGRGRRNADKEAEKEDQKAEDKAPEDKAAAGGRGRRASPANDADKSESKGRRGRNAATGNKADNLVNDNAEQKEMRERLQSDLLILADHDEAIDDVTEALQRTGAANIKAVPSDMLPQLDEDIGVIFDKHGI